MVNASLADRLLKHHQLLIKLARRYVWWLAPEEALEYPHRVVAQVMNTGVFQDVVNLIQEVGEEALKEVLLGAEAGQFDPASWHYWHYRLGFAAPGEVPPLPRRNIPM
jgi:hypothetical protein